MTIQHNWPSIDHSLLSPSGKASKRARVAALKREGERLFPPGFWDAGPLTAAQVLGRRILALRRRAANLSELADRGMNPARYRRVAASLMAEAERMAAS